MSISIADCECTDTTEGSPPPASAPDRGDSGGESGTDLVPGLAGRGEAEEAGCAAASIDCCEACDPLRERPVSTLPSASAARITSSRPDELCRRAPYTRWPFISVQQGLHTRCSFFVSSLKMRILLCEHTWHTHLPLEKQHNERQVGRHTSYTVHINKTCGVEPTSCDSGAFAL
jgi:hypothetical protein